MKTKITLQTVKAIKPPSNRYVVWDSEIKGFGLRVNCDGTKTYVLKYVLGAQQRWFTIGKHGSPWTPEQARNEAIKLLGRIKDGADPAELKKLKRAAGISVAELCDEYLSAVEEGRIISKRGACKKASTLATDRGRIERHIKPVLGAKPVKDITCAHVAQFRDSIASGKTATNVKTKPRGRAIVKGGRGTATRTLGLLGGIFTYAVKQGLRSDNPVRGVERFKDRACERYLTSDEMVKLGLVLCDAERAWQRFQSDHKGWQTSGKMGPAPIPVPEAENPIALAAIRMLLLTGMRKSEVLGLKWENLDIERRLIRLPDSKTGKKEIPLSLEVGALLGSLRHLSENPYVFVGQKRGQCLVGLPRIWKRVSQRAKLDGVRLHDLRHTFASFGAAGGTTLYVLGKLLGHSDAKTTARYAHLGDDPLRAGVEKISRGISDLIGSL